MQLTFAYVWLRVLGFPKIRSPLKGGIWGFYTDTWVLGFPKIRGAFKGGYGGSILPGIYRV